jgi:PAS domain S-box-containing protein
MIWLFGEAFYYASVDEKDIIFWTYFRYLGIPYVPLSTFALVFKFVSKKSVRIKLIHFIAIIPIFSSILAYTNSFHHLFWTNYKILNYSGVLNFIGERGVFYKYVYLPYSYILLLFSVLLLSKMFFTKDSHKKTLSLQLTAGIIFPFIANVIFITSKENIIDYTPFFFVVTSFVFYFSIQSFGLLDLLPFAKKLIFQNLNDPIVIISQDGTIIEINKSALLISGFTSEFIIGKNISSFYEVIGIQENIGVDSEVENQRLCIKSNSKSEKVVLFSSTNIESNGKTFGKIIEFNDITTLDKAMKELELAKEKAEEASMFKTTFIANISHEIRTPMNGIIGMSELLDESGLNDEQKVYTSSIVHSGKILLEIINNILDISKIENKKMSLEKVEFNPYIIFEATIKTLMPLIKNKHVRITSRFSDNLPVRTLGDSTRISQILFNILGNAIKFTQEGFIDINIQGIDFTQNKYCIKLTIRDSGIGIPEEKLHKLFDNFYQTDPTTTRKYGGTGLGLSITRQLTEMMNGSIHVESEVDKGSTFEVIIPLEYLTEEKESSKKIIYEKNEDLTMRISKILLAEDNSVNINLMKLIFSKMGIPLDVAYNGKEAILMAEKDEYSAILMDIQMPELDGIEATMLIRMNSNVPIIGLSANNSPQDIEMCKKAGMNGFIGKPFTLEKFKNELSNYIK